MSEQWDWGPAWNKLRQDVNVLAWLFEEERVIQRLYIENVVWALTGKGCGVDEFVQEMGIGSAAASPVDESERAAESALDQGS